MGDKIELLAWDTEWLGFPVARLTVGYSDAATVIATAIDQCRTTGIRLLYLSLNPTETVGAAVVNAGAWFVDMKLIFELPVSPTALLSGPPQTMVLTKTTVLTPALEQLALQSGACSRFRRDTRIGAPTFASLYKQWLQQCLHHGTVWAASVENRTIGLLAFAVRDSYASIDLVAVDPAARGQGIGRALVQATEKEAQQNGFSKLQVVTQGANQPAQALYQRCGFRLATAINVYHLWL